MYLNTLQNLIQLMYRILLLIVSDTTDIRSRYAQHKTTKPNHVHVISKSDLANKPPIFFRWQTMFTQFNKNPHHILPRR